MSWTIGKSEIHRWELVNGTEVPVDRWGHYLNWLEIYPGRREADRLTDPYWARTFAVGNGEGGGVRDITFYPDYAMLPDQSVIIHIVENSEFGGYVEDFAYKRLRPEDAVREAEVLTDQMLDILAENGIMHDHEYHGQDPWMFQRSLEDYINRKTGSDRVQEDTAE